MEMSEFLREPETPVEPEDIDVQKAVVESLAADKAEQAERIEKLQKENYSLKSKLAKLEDKLTQQADALAKVGDVLATNSDSPAVSNKVALIDREMELDERFPGEMRDMVLEVIKLARDTAEQEGRLRRAQVLEAVLVANEPVGNLIKNRETLERFFRENGNILSGPVIDELNKQEISYKNGDEYLLLNEILKRTF